jgi:membrane protein YqaA with SNARE-associated domain
MLSWTGETGLAALFAAAFLSATVLPGNSEVVLYAILRSFPEHAAMAMLVATVGNTLGSLTTFGLGRLLPAGQVPSKLRGRGLELVKRYGAWALLLAWLPVVGDVACAAAGWLRLPWLVSALAIATGKFARYLVVAQVANLL